MDDDSGMNFQRKEQSFEQPRKIEYSGGGGGGGKPYTVSKTSFFSRTCYSDPNNPGKMICKNQSSGNYFDGNRTNEYRKESPEEVFDTNNFFGKKTPYYGNYNNKSDEGNFEFKLENEDNFIKRMHYRIKNFFFGGNGEDEKYPNHQSKINNYNPYTQTNNPYSNHNPYINHNQYNPFNNSYNNTHNAYFNNDNSFFGFSTGEDPFFSNNPYRSTYDDFENDFHQIVSNLLRDSLIGHRFLDDSFMNNSNVSSNSIFPENSDPFFNRNTFPSNFNKNFPQNNYPSNTYYKHTSSHYPNGFYNINNNPETYTNIPTPNLNTGQIPSYPNNNTIRYRDHKIYDV